VFVIGLVAFLHIIHLIRIQNLSGILRQGGVAVGWGRLTAASPVNPRATVDYMPEGALQRARVHDRRDPQIRLAVAVSIFVDAASDIVDLIPGLQHRQIIPNLLLEFRLPLWVG
jgi:hypothetical protein